MLLEDLIPSEECHIYSCPKTRPDCLHRVLFACLASFILYVQQSELLTEALLPASITQGLCNAIRQFATHAMFAFLSVKPQAIF
jgi:hypothetical protein